jgi:acetyl-CoA C-acetyltransferase
MNNTYVIGYGATQVGEHFARSLNDLATEALRKALGAIDPGRIGALYIANALGEALGVQGQLATAIADACGLQGIEAVRVEAAGASGGVALRQASLAVAAGAYDLVAVIGVEKATDRLDGAVEAALALASDGPHEADHGITLTSQWAMLMRRYMHEYGYPAEAFAPFPVNAHANATKNPQAMYRFPINADKYRGAQQIASPLNMLDCASVADGAAALIIASEGVARELPGPRIRIAGSAQASDTLALHSRRDPLLLDAARRSAAAAMAQANVEHAAINVLELTDPHGIAAALALEAMGFYERGTAPRHAADGAISPTGRTPLATAGGYKARGDCVGASGVYQVIELVRQLRGEAGATQVAGARVALAQCLGGVGGTAVTTILEAEPA